MPQRYVWKLVAPTFFLGAFLLGVGVFAAWNVQSQQQTSSDLIAREVQGMIAIEELNLEMREIRYQLNLFLRTGDLKHIRNVVDVHAKADSLLGKARTSARTKEEIDYVEVASEGYGEFFKDFDNTVRDVIARNEELSKTSQSDASPAAEPSLTARERESLEQMSKHWDQILTTGVLEPLEKCIAENKRVVERTKDASEEAARHLTVGFLLLGLCGGIAGILWGVGMGRAIGRSIVQLSVSVRGASSKLSDLRGAVTVTHRGDLVGLEAGIKALEQNIASAVEQLQQRERELIRSEQLARVGQLAAGLAHELRNPLMPMKMLVQAAIERGDDHGLKGRSLQILNEEISRLEHSIQLFLDFARPPTPQKQWVDLAEIVQGTSFLIQGRCQQQSISLSVSVPNHPVVVSVDQSQIKQLLLNLLLNAIDAVKHDGRIAVELQPRAKLPTTADRAIEEIEPTHAIEFESEHQALRPMQRRASDPVPDCAVISVTDNGDGIPQNIIDRIFEPFVTSKESGTGLGLSICKRIADMHRGTLVATNLSTGAQFSLYLPLDAKPQSNSNKP